MEKVSGKAEFRVKIIEAEMNTKAKNWINIVNSFLFTSTGSVLEIDLMSLVFIFYRVKMRRKIIFLTLRIL